MDREAAKNTGDKIAGATKGKDVGSKADAAGLTACATKAANCGADHGKRWSAPRLRGQAHLRRSPLHGALNGGVFCDPAALGGPAEGLWGRLEELFGLGETGQVGGEAGDFRD